MSTDPWDPHHVTSGLSADARERYRNSGVDAAGALYLDGVGKSVDSALRAGRSPGTDGTASTSHRQPPGPSAPGLLRRLVKGAVMLLVVLPLGVLTLWAAAVWLYLRWHAG